MAKVPHPGVDDDDDDVLWAGRTLTIRAMRDANKLPALEWLKSLDRADSERFDAASTILDTSRRSGRPHPGAIAPVFRTTCNLQLFRITQRGAASPHLRLMHIQQGDTMWVALGTHCTADFPSDQQLAIAEHIARRWLSA